MFSNLLDNIISGSISNWIYSLACIVGLLLQFGFVTINEKILDYLKYTDKNINGLVMTILSSISQILLFATCCCYAPIVFFTLVFFNLYKVFAIVLLLFCAIIYAISITKTFSALYELYVEQKCKMWAFWLSSYLIFMFRAFPVTVAYNALLIAFEGFEGIEFFDSIINLAFAIIAIVISIKYAIKIHSTKKQKQHINTRN